MRINIVQLLVSCNVPADLVNAYRGVKAGDDLIYDASLVLNKAGVVAMSEWRIWIPPTRSGLCRLVHVMRESHDRGGLLGWTVYTASTLQPIVLLVGVAKSSNSNWHGSDAFKMSKACRSKITTPACNRLATS